MEHLFQAECLGAELHLIRPMILWLTALVFDGISNVSTVTRMKLDNVSNP